MICEDQLEVDMYCGPELKLKVFLHRNWKLPWSYFYTKIKQIKIVFWLKWNGYVVFSSKHTCLLYNVIAVCSVMPGAEKVNGTTTNTSKKGFELQLQKWFSNARDRGGGSRKTSHKENSEDATPDNWICVMHIWNFRTGPD